MENFEAQVIQTLATLTERQTNHHNEVIKRLDTANGRLNKHEDILGSHQTFIDQSKGFWKGVAWLKAGVVVAIVEGAKLFWAWKKHG